MKVPSEQHGSYIWPIHKQEPQKKFDAWDTFGFPKSLEKLMHLQVFKHHLIVSSGKIILVTPN
jgi:hypothetical protein